MILKNKDPLQDHLAKNNPGSGSNILNLNRDRDRLQKYWAHISTFLLHFPVFERFLEQKKRHLDEVDIWTNPEETFLCRTMARLERRSSYSKLNIKQNTLDNFIDKALES